MDWRSVRFDWNRARAFLVTAEEGSLSAAARALGMTQPTLGRQVAALEKELGVSLFERVGKGLALTPNGLDLMEHVRAMGEAANQLSRSAMGRTEQLEGSICITATEVVAAHVLPPIIARIRHQHPGIDIELVASNETSDLKRREADIAVRAFRPTQPDLVARRMRDMGVALYASPSYLASLGEPPDITALNGADFIGFDRGQMLIDALNALGLSLTRANFPVITMNHLVHWQLVRQGIAIGLMPVEIGDREPDVMRVLPEMPLIPVETWLVAHRDLRTSRRVRTVFDILAADLA